MKYRNDFLAAAFLAVALTLVAGQRPALPDLLLQLAWPSIDIAPTIRDVVLFAVVTLIVVFVRAAERRAADRECATLLPLRRPFAVLATSFLVLPVTVPPGSLVSIPAMIFSLLSVAYAYPSLVFSSGGLLPREGKARLAGQESGTNPR